MVYVCLQASAFASWKEAAAFRTVKRTALANSVKHLLQGTLGRAFAAWRDNIAQRAVLKQKAASCLARFAHAHIARAFSAWVDWSATQKEHRSTLMHMFNPLVPSQFHSVCTTELCMPSAHSLVYRNRSSNSMLFLLHNFD